MPTFGQTSQNRLSHLDHRLVRICYRVIRTFDFSVLETFRSNERQAELLAQNKTTVGPGESKHNSYPSLAVDVAPWPIDWNDPKRFIFMAGHFFQAASEEGVVIRWGGNWDGDLIIIDDQNFDDLPHIELVLDS